MSTHTCCQAGRGQAADVGQELQGRKSGRIRRWGSLRAIASGVLLMLMPKCPLCLAGYLSVATGIGISFTTAKYLRILLIVLCVGSLSYFLLRRLLRHVRIG